MQLPLLAEAWRRARNYHMVEILWEKKESTMWRKCCLGKASMPSKRYDFPRYKPLQSGTSQQWNNIPICKIWWFNPATHFQVFVLLPEKYLEQNTYFTTCIRREMSWYSHVKNVTKIIDQSHVSNLGTGAGFLFVQVWFGTRCGVLQMLFSHQSVVWLF